MRNYVISSLIFLVVISSTNANTTEINGVFYTIAPNQTYTGADFTGADFSGVNLTGSTFTNCILNNANFNGATLVGVTFSYDASLGQHDLSRSIIFDNANLIGASFLNVELDDDVGAGGVEASFVNSTLLNITLSTPQMATNSTDEALNLPQYYTFLPVNGQAGLILGPYINLSGQDLTSLSNIVNDLNLRGLPLMGVDLSNANLSDLHVPGINFTGANFQNSTFNNTIISNSTFQYADFTGAVLDNADISYSDQGFAKYNNTSMSNVYIWSCYLGGTDFTGADINGIQSGSCGYTNNTPPILPSGYVLRNGHIVGPNANLTDATFNNFSFVDQDFSGANLTGVNFRYATLSNANFAGATLLNANLYESDLSNANLTGTDIRGANLTGTSVTLTASEMAEFDVSGCNITGTVLLHVEPDQSNSDQVGLSTENLTLSKIGNELQIYWDGAENEIYQLFYSTNGVNWNSYAPTTCEWAGDAIVGREIPTSEEVSDRLLDGGNQYKIIRMAVAHSMESMTNASIIMFKVESAHATEFN